MQVWPIAKKEALSVSEIAIAPIAFGRTGNPPYSIPPYSSSWLWESVEMGGEVGRARRQEYHLSV
jgi:hypothetical protein